MMEGYVFKSPVGLFWIRAPARKRRALTGSGSTMSGSVPTTRPARGGRRVHQQHRFGTNGTRCAPATRRAT